ncbi:glycosyl hydrolase [Frondihabitans sp. VKM Ac-2883]|uniref:glycosyl hydrolase n=1 Tax=Frondihabitans sp. VKM Ac-2883 TaxID=2783823 RepID=UPI00188A6A25|nr:1,3-beta-glucanase [Frondihabitans sp. VKM Ac-2883]
MPLGAGQKVLGDDTVGPLLDKLVTRSIAATPKMRLAEGLTPPTNKWFSGLVFGDTPMAVFPYPLSFQQTATGFNTGLPVVTGTENTVFGEAVTQVSADLGADSAIVSAYDSVSVTIEYLSGSRILGHVTIAEGSPLVSYTAARAGSVTLNGPIDTSGSDGTLTVSGQKWSVATSDATIAGPQVTLEKGGSLTLFPVPEGTSATDVTALQKAAASPLTGVTTTYASTSAGQKTKLAYRTAASTTKAPGSTLVVPLPHQGADASAGCTSASYAGLYGTTPLCISSGLSFTTPTITATSSLDLTKVSSSNKAALKSQLEVDVKLLPTFATDTYYGGKSLYRAAMLLQLARQLGDDASEKTLTTALTTQIDKWMEPGGCTTRAQECFVYDAKLKTIVGLANSFGSEEDNDHHFHYGYFLYAAGVVAQSTPSLAAKWAPVMNLLAADIATNTGDGSGKYFPDTRVYDPYFSHSWASGYSPFADGNNQESSSEAVNAWTGLALWAKASGDSALEGEANWLLSGETASALAYYVNPSLDEPQFDGFSHDLVSLNWGGKRDYATWFSAAPSAIIGIQLIPMSPVSTYLGSSAGGGASHIKKLVAAALTGGADATLIDYVLMYESLAGKDAAASALAAAKKLPSTAIDNGNSRTYLLAYIMAQEAGA